MTRCSDFYKKWEQEPNWCEKCKSTVSLINNYLDLVSELNSRGIDREIIYAKFPEKAARPVFQIKDPEIRNKTLNYTCSCLTRSEKVQAGDLKNLISSYEGKGKPEKPVEDRPDELTKVNSVTPVPEVNLPPLSPDAPMSERLKRDEQLLQMALATNQSPPGFQTGTELINGGLVTKPAPIKVSPVQFGRETAEDLLIQWVRGYLTNKDREALGAIIRTGEFGKTYNEIFTGMLWYCHDAMQG